MRQRLWLLWLVLWLVVPGFAYAQQLNDLQIASFYDCGTHDNPQPCFLVRGVAPSPTQWSRSNILNDLWSRSFFHDGQGMALHIAGVANYLDPIPTGPLADLPTTCLANHQVYLVDDTSPPVLYLCNSLGTGFNVVGSGASGANPTGTIGLSVVNGSASTFMRSDAAPPLSQTISPTMSGNWLFTGRLNVPHSTTLPATCSVGDVYMDTDATSGLRWYLCESTNTWMVQGAGGATGANPTATIGLTVVNGSASTFLRSDGAPPLSQTISPTWSGNHTFTGRLNVPHSGSLPGTCSVGDVYMDTAATTGQQWYLCETPNTFVAQTGGGSGTPGGVDTSVQFNNSGSFGGFGAWDGTTLAIPGALAAQDAPSRVVGLLDFEDGTPDGFNNGDGGVTIVTSPVLSGTYAAAIPPLSYSTSYLLDGDIIVATFLFEVAALPSQAQSILDMDGGEGNTRFALWLKTDGHLGWSNLVTVPPVSFIESSANAIVVNAVNTMVVEFRRSTSGGFKVTLNGVAQMGAFATNTISQGYNGRDVVFLTFGPDQTNGGQTQYYDNISLSYPRLDVTTRFRVVNRFEVAQTEQLSITYLSQSAFGSRQVYINPLERTDPSGGEQTAIPTQMWFAGLNNPQSYGNLIGIRLWPIFFNGRNAEDNSDKKTISALYANPNFNAAGQKFLMNLNPIHAGVGDGFGIDLQHYCGGYKTATGDEGCSMMTLHGRQPGNITLALTSVSTATGSTTLAGSVTKSTLPYDYKTVQVASTSGFTVGDWITVEQGVFEKLSGGDANVETTQIQAIGAGPCPGASCTLTALFQANHASGKTVQRAQVIAGDSNTMNDGFWGQNRLVVDSSVTPYSTGNADATEGSFIITGHSTAWTSTLVGGTVNFPGCFAFTGDNTTGGTREYWPIQSVDSNTQMTLSRAYSNKVPGTNPSGAAYVFVPCGRIGAFVVASTVADPTTNAAYGEQITGIVMEGGQYTWVTSHTVEQTISPYQTFNPVHIYVHDWEGILRGGSLLTLGDKTLGGTQWQAALRIEDSQTDDATHARYVNGIRVQGNTSVNAVVLEGRNLAGSGIARVTYGTSDPKKDIWAASSGIDGTESYPIANGHRIATHNGTFSLYDITFAKETAFTYGGHVADRTISIPDKSGELILWTGGTITRTIPTSGSGNNVVGIGNFDSPTGQAVLFIAVSGPQRAKQYFFAVGYNMDSGAWTTLAPAWEGDYASATEDFAIDGRANADGSLDVRLRRLAGSGGNTHFIAVYETSGRSTTFTPDSTVSNASAPASYSSATVLTQKAGAAFQTKITASATAPGAGLCKEEWVAGTTGGTCKKVAYCGTSGTAVTLIDNVGSGC